MTQQQQLRSTVTSGGQLKLELAQIEVPAPTSNEVLVRVEASPINPSDPVSYTHLEPTRPY